MSFVMSYRDDTASDSNADGEIASSSDDAHGLSMEAREDGKWANAPAPPPPAGFESMPSAATLSSNNGGACFGDSNSC